ncbi:unnamed protein product [Linum trigynum]|uniref:Uncharacterized protein n=1 Tax=Linum trigynum TaxID=586398 RepID=A0AAV2FAT2_9ROSI
MIPYAGYIVHFVVETPAARLLTGTLRDGVVRTGSRREESTARRRYGDLTTGGIDGIDGVMARGIDIDGEMAT